jgi:hypothetical protein
MKPLINHKAWSVAFALWAYLMCGGSAKAADVCTVNGTSLACETLDATHVQAVAAYAPNGIPLPVAPLNYGVGTGSFNSPPPVTVATTATLLVAARAGAIGTGRAAVTITCAAAVAIAPTSGVTFAGNAQIPAVGALTLNTTSAIYGIASGSSTTCNVWETY